MSRRPSGRAIARRAAFKLAEIDDKHHLLRPGMIVVDLGRRARRLEPDRRAAGQVMAGKGQVIAVDLVADGADPGRDPARPRHDRCRGAGPHPRGLGGQKADIVLSDMHASATGHKSTDHLRIMGLVEAALDLAEDILVPGGTFLAKVLQGGAEQGAGGAPQPLLRQGPPCQAEGVPRRLGRDVCAGHRLPRRGRDMRRSRNCAACLCCVGASARC